MRNIYYLLFIIYYFRNSKSRIINNQLSTITAERGFTLVELLAVIMVIGVISGVAGAIIISSLVGTNKTNALESVRQNGNYALLQITKQIGFSRNFYGVSTDDENYITDCTVASVSPTPVPVKYSFLKIVGNDGAIIAFSCSGSTISSNSDSLIDATAVKTTSCFFSCTQNNSFLPPTIGVSFTLSQKKAGNFIENITSIPFNSSVTLRNSNR